MGIALCTSRTKIQDTAHEWGQRFRKTCFTQRVDTYFVGIVYLAKLIFEVSDQPRNGVHHFHLLHGVHGISKEQKFQSRCARMLEMSTLQRKKMRLLRTEMLRRKLKKQKQMTGQRMLVSSLLKCCSLKKYYKNHHQNKHCNKHNRYHYLYHLLV